MCVYCHHPRINHKCDVYLIELNQIERRDGETERRCGERERELSKSLIQIRTCYVIPRYGGGWEEEIEKGWVGKRGEKGKVIRL